MGQCSRNSPEGALRSCTTGTPKKHGGDNAPRKGVQKNHVEGRRGRDRQGDGRGEGTGVHEVAAGERVSSQAF